jgi:H+-transporting ATPase
VFFFIAILALRPRDGMPDHWRDKTGFDKHEWPRFFEMPVLMLMLITLLNDGTLIAIGYERYTHYVQVIFALVCTVR